MSSESESSSEKTGSATKNAWIAGVGAVVGALLTATATVFAAQIQAGASKPSQSATPNPFMTSGDQNAQPNAAPNSPSQNPSPTETPASKSPTPQSPLPIMLKDLVSLEDYSWEIRESQIDGERYPNSIWPSPCSIIQTSDQTYIISKDYKRFKATIGIDDFSERASPVSFTITGDGGTIYHRKIYPGPPVKIDVPVSGVVRLILEIKIHDYNSDCDETLAVWANPRLEK